MARPATARPATGVSSTARRSTTALSDNPTSRMTVPSTAAPSPKTTAQPNMATVGWAKGGRPGMDKEKVPNPVNEPRPTKMSVPMPAASRPGMRTRAIIGPPRPDASMRRKAPRMGDPNRVLMAAKPPAAAMTMEAVGGASRLANRTDSRPRPPPMAISGASGPRTAPRLKVARAARATPGSSTGGGGTARLEALSRHVTTGPRQVGEGQRDQQPGQDQEGQGPPHRRPRESHCLGQRFEQPPLEQADQLEEPEGDGGHRNPDDARRGPGAGRSSGS